MVQLDLSSEDAGVLAQALDCYLSDLRMEIADTDLMDFRERLKAEKLVLTHILDTLRTAA